ncbi:MAG: methionine aminotransferase [Flavobacteriaceae bacterium]|jgi:methionine transaminase|nr:methionine aminotransferase [Flavobacteriaceae bacterium]MDA7567861.1 methionine aminotransferase [Flavobacteriaceae bacterium]MDG1379872.1 methionine aminotransferase [Flavobacteriaceae bacterium]MDG2350958.1 methionine aminotransferase [Flavobacteriaceae bacterium]|tara:strand:+ start:22490 stop:23632 length:1143 start_codon:yes stop_codon:yes gene_type:complete
MNYFSKLPHLKPSIFSVMSALAQEHDAVNLSQGFPDFKGDQKLINLVSQAMNEGHNHYAPMSGVFPLREAIAKKYDLLYGSTYHPDGEIVITAGATQAIYAAITAFVHTNDEVIVFNPAFDCYIPTIELCGGKAVSIQLKYPDYKIDWEEVKQTINLKTRMIIINTPHNPTGTVLSKYDMLQLQELTLNTNIIVLSDEVYEHIIFDGQQHQSVCLFSNLKKRSFITASFGKTFHNTGWKVGYACAPKELMHEFLKVHEFTVFSVHHPSQRALAQYLSEPSHYQELSELFQSKRDLFLNLIKASRFSFKPSKGTYFQALNFSNISQENDYQLAKQLTKVKKIASIPFSVFNVNNLDEKMLRFCFAKTDETLVKAAEILNKV